MVFYRTDCESVWLRLRHQEKQLINKRKWLLGIPVSSSKKKQRKHLERLKNESLPESLLREDDVFYEIVKARVEDNFGAGNVERNNYLMQADILISDSDIRKITKILTSSIDDLSNKGLYVLIGILIGDNVKFENTRPKMKTIIKGILPKFLGSQIHNPYQVDIFKRLFQLLNDRRNFRRNYCTSLIPGQSYCLAVTKILNGLGELDTQSLFAMHRKFKGVEMSKGGRDGRSRDYLISQVKKDIRKMLPRLGEDDEVQEPLAKAMAIADLSLRVAQGCHYSSTVNFYNFSPQIKDLHDEIVKAIQFVSSDITFEFEQLKKLQPLLDHDCKISNRSLRTAVKKKLMDYLFECSDMDNIPVFFLEVLAIINTNKSSSAANRYFPKEEIDDEVERILDLSAQIKQVVWDLLPFHAIDQDYDDAYREELNECDDGGHSDGELSDEGTDASDSGDNMECSGSMPFNQEQTYALKGNPSPLLSPGKEVYSDSAEKLQSEDFNREGSDKENLDLKNEDFNGEGSDKVNPYLNNEDFNIESSDRENLYQKNEDFDREGSDTENLYLKIQDACDETSMMAYNLIGHMLDEFAKIQDIDLDRRHSSYLRGGYPIEKESQGTEDKQKISPENVEVIVRACEKLMPSFPQSGYERLKKLMEL